MAQWEEYYTGELPHAMGNFGVTEVNYSLGLLAIWNSFIDRETFWSRTMGESLPESILEILPVQLPESVLAMEAGHFGMAGWLVISVILVLGSFYRVLNH